MKEMIRALKHEAHRHDVSADLGEVFDLLSAACEQCCGQHTGGNKTCPPPPEIKVLSES